MCRLQCDYMRDPKTSKHNIGDTLYMVVRMRVYKGRVLSIEDRVGANKIMYELKTSKKVYWREENDVSDNLDILKEVL